MPDHPERGRDDRPERITPTDSSPQVLGEIDEPPIPQRLGRDDARLDVERERVEALAVRAVEPDRGERPARVLPRVREGRQVPGDDAEPVRGRGGDEA